MLNRTIFSIEDAETALKVDYVICSVSGPLEKFLKKNRYAVYVACNTWLTIMDDLGVPVGLLYEVRAVIRSYGLYACVNVCRGLADEVLLGFLDSLPLPGEHQWLNSRVPETNERPFLAILDYIGEASAESIAEYGRCSLQILLYLERFTYDGSTSMGTASVGKFVAANQRCREFEYDWSNCPGQSLGSMISCALAEMITEEHFVFDEGLCGFSSGSYTEAMMDPDPDPFKKSPAGKWAALSRYRTYWCDLMYPLPHSSNKWRSYRKPVLTLVPKTFASYRVIFPEDIVMSFYAHGVLEAFRKMLERNGTSRFINERNQSVNRELSRMGSHNQVWATIDMSSASDTISKALAFSYVPMWFRPYLLGVTSNECVQLTTGQPIVRKLFTLLTSGNPMTWIFQSVWFIAVGRVAASLCGDPSPELCVFSYGDDMIVRKEYYETTCELLATLGHTVNIRKSYSTGGFRESCGGWFYNSEDITPTFWPRRVFPTAKVEYYPVLIDLQHKAAKNCWHGMNSFLCAEIRSQFPKVTSSSIGSVYSDLWDWLCDEYSDDLSDHLQVEEVVRVMPPYTGDLVQMVAYVEYLARGPLYESELDRLLGTSSSRLERYIFYGTGKFRFTM